MRRRQLSANISKGRKEKVFILTRQKRYSYRHTKMESSLDIYTKNLASFLSHLISSLSTKSNYNLIRIVELFFSALILSSRSSLVSIINSFLWKLFYNIVILCYFLLVGKFSFFKSKIKNERESHSWSNNSA